jgi:hypothetical protein
MKNFLRQIPKLYAPETLLPQIAGFQSRVLISKDIWVVFG